MRIGVLASGSGTLLDAILTEKLPVAVVLVDRKCRATDVARKHAVKAVLIERSFGDDFDRLEFTEEVVDVLRHHRVELVVMAGWGTIFEKPIFDAFPARVINTHPALLPSFPGWHAVRAALEAGVKVTGCTVHVATLDVDSGPIIAQESVPVLPSDTEETLHERIKEVERRLYTDTIKAIVERGRV
ncbi:MAG: phosphoribosylglycinamide formyltransferase [Acidimicrobiales bacterium]